MRRFLAVFAITVAVAAAGCGGTSGTPTTPSTGGGGGSTPPPPPNNPPVINTITVQGSRTSEPANFADLAEAVDVAATVHDDETPVEQLQYVWTASVGAFDGTGARVRWIAPASAKTPIDVTISLKVVEKFGYPGQAQIYTNTTQKDAIVSLHDSQTEVGSMARQFLLDFSDSNIPVEVVMRNFDMTCPEAQAEAQQVTENRKILRIVKSSILAPTVTVPFGNSRCPIPGRVQRGDACSATPSHWESILLSNNHYTIADGVDWVSAYYHADVKAWKLCDSQFPGTCIDTTTGRPCSDSQASAMVAGSWRRQ